MYVISRSWRWPLVDSQRGNKDHSPTTQRNWTLPKLEWPWSGFVFICCSRNRKLIGPLKILLNWCILTDVHEGLLTEQIHLSLWDFIKQVNDTENKTREVRKEKCIEDSKVGKGTQEKMWSHRHNLCPAVQKTHSFPQSNLIPYFLIIWAPSIPSFIHATCIWVTTLYQTILWSYPHWVQSHGSLLC